MIKNIFLDAGGVILDESIFEDLSGKIITEIVRQYNTSYSPENYQSDIKEAVYRFVPKVYDYVLYRNIINIEDYMKAKNQYKRQLKNENIGFQITEGIEDFLNIFSKYYQIGIIGQYGNDLIAFLESKELLQYFSFREIQDNYKITKPDPRYFAAILNKCNCAAEESIMLGDRIDKDIIPAKIVGMKTIRIKTGIHKNQEPRIPEEIPDLTVEKLNNIKIEAIKALDN